MSELGPIFHLYYSEKIQVTRKYEPQSAHFNKRQYSVYFTVVHTSNIDSETGKRFCCLYHLSDKKKHDFAFSFAVIDGIVNCEDFSLTDCDCLRFKSDNCFCQYKHKNTLANWSQLPWLTSKIVIVYFGVIGDLVDAMSSFGVKCPLWNAIITVDFLPLKICISG